MNRLELLEHRVKIANKLSALGSFVPGDGEGSTIKTHRMVVSVDLRGTWTAFMFSESSPLHGNPDGIRSVNGWGRTKEEAVKDAFALLWYPRGSESRVMPPDVAQSMRQPETDHERNVRIMGESLMQTGLVLMPVELMRRAVKALEGADIGLDAERGPANDGRKSELAQVADEVRQYLPMEKS